MSEIDEDELIRQIANLDGRKRVFPLIVNQYSQQLYWKIRSIVFHHEDADDVLQNTFLKVWKNLRTFEGKSKLSTWLYRIAINEALDFLRKKKVQLEVRTDSDFSIANSLLADEYFDGDLGQALLQEAISTLPDVQRTVFTLRYYDEMKYSEISKILDTSEGSLKASYHIAVQKITDYIRNHK